MNNKGWGLNEMLICCGLLGIAFIVAVALIEQNFKDLSDSLKENTVETHTYEQIESSFVQSSMKYIEDQNIEMENGSTIKITNDTLLHNGYIKKMYDKNENLCDGYVVFSKEKGKYTYSPYIKCGSSYQTEGFKK